MHQKPCKNPLANKLISIYNLKKMEFKQNYPAWVDRAFVKILEQFNENHSARYGLPP